MRVQARGIGEGEVAEVVVGDEPVVDELVGFHEDPGEVAHVPVAHVGSEDRLEARAECVTSGVERRRVHRVVGLAAEVEPIDEAGTEVVDGLDVARAPVVDIVGSVLRAREEAAHSIEISALTRRAVLLEQFDDLVDVEPCRVELADRLAVALLPVADEIGEQRRAPGDTAFEEHEVECGEATRHAAEEQ